VFSYVLFDNDVGREAILFGGPWSFASSRLVLMLCYDSFDNLVVRNQLLLWVRLPNLPLHLWDQTISRFVGDKIRSYQGLAQETLDKKGTPPLWFYPLFLEVSRKKLCFKRMTNDGFKC
jgi:hypothetical protein